MISAVLDGEIISGTAIDITDKKKAEDALRVSSEHLRRADIFGQFIRKVAIAANEASNIEEPLHVTIDAVCDLIGWPVGHAYICSRETADELCSMDIWHIDDPKRFDSFRDATMATKFRCGVGLPGQVFAATKPIWVTDVTEDPRFLRAQAAREVGLKSGLFFPVLSNRDVKAVMEFFSTEAVGPDHELLDIFHQAGTQLGRAIERTQTEEKIHHLAFYDTLTGLPNKSFFRDLLRQTILTAGFENRPLAILAIGVEHFKEINNTLGYQNGDIILRLIGSRLSECVRDADIVARIGGDGFAIFMENNDIVVANGIALKITKRFEEPFVIEGVPVDISIRIGISFFPGHGDDADTLIRRAHVAIDTAKQREADFCTYSPEYDKYSQDRLILISELRTAISEDQLFLLYQPKINLKDARLIGAEALVRWQHPKSGIIPPNDFISLAERTGIIKQLTYWVLKEAIRQSRCWTQMGHEVSIAVNISVKNLQTPQFMDQIKGLLSTWGVDPGWLRFEITESIIMQNPELAMETITELTSMGIKFSIDDFGTGYSSLGYLQRFPVDELKIDKSFVMDMMKNENSRKIITTMIELGHSLELKITAEGVENKETLDILSRLGCDAVQGYFISRPISQVDFTGWLEKHSRGDHQYKV
ncbi:MAG: GGDEF domain-containing protein [Nitrospirae bacterium]|nr:GGDEF domain-containing protein [Nitrospirota bacterium]